MAEEFQAELVCGGNWRSSQFMGNYGSCWQQNEFMNYVKTNPTDECSGGCATAILPDSAIQIMGSSPSSTTNNWDQALLMINERNGEDSYNPTLPEILNNLSADGQETSNFMATNSSDCNGNLVTTNSYDGYPSSLLLQTFIESTSSAQQQSVYDVNLVTSMPGFSFLEKSKQQVVGGLELANKVPFWNSSMLDLNENQAGNFTSTLPQYLSSAYGEKTNCANMKSQIEEIPDLGSSIKKSSVEKTFKRPRLETPSPLPTFKVRKEKLGDRVTALQQLVSPFGKTDTASVLYEAFEYIKLLHDQVNVLSTPYMKNGTEMQHQQSHNKVKDVTEGAKKELRSRGLCLVPIASTFPVATDTSPDYWTSSFRNSFK
ncbi:transcription factor bHLH112-like [Rutidosis leptorrhynchoides]|uniref:transcription factor bHLH112-like n=1 Tax=Rutidosis leptorrhynchoides TaxID=125765 RepID=UPI003A992AA0